jgi:two-component SAPR family response regulator
MSDPLPPLRVLVLEDEWMIAEEISYGLSEAGMTVVGPVPDVVTALAVLEEQKVDLAILNVRLKDGDSVPVAKKLEEKSIPFIFVSGNEVMPEPFSHHERLPKPLDPEHLVKVIRKAVQRAAG